MVILVDYGIGNLRSIEKALEAVGASVIRTDDASTIVDAERLVLPGVGAFGACVGELRKRGLEPAIKDFVASGRPFLGVCVGMQMMFETSEEMGEHRGLGIIPGRVVRINAERSDKTLKVPHMGWNAVDVRASASLLQGLGPSPFFYFVHSYHAVAADQADVLGTTEYGHAFPAIVGRNMAFGVQFHPEKSQLAGLRLLENFVGLS